MIYNVVLVSGVQKSESVTHIHIFTLFLDSSHIGHYRVLSRTRLILTCPRVRESPPPLISRPAWPVPPSGALWFECPAITPSTDCNALRVQGKYILHFCALRPTPTKNIDSLSIARGSCRLPVSGLTPQHVQFSPHWSPPTPVSFFHLLEPPSLSTGFSGSHIH